MLRDYLPAATRPRLLGCVAAALALAACATLRVGSDHDPKANFAAYHTFAWMPPHAKFGEARDPLVVQRAHDAIEQTLTAKGYRLVSEPAEADFVVDFTIGARERTDIYSYPALYRGPWLWTGPYWWGAPYWGNSIDVRQYRQGTISVDVFDGRTHRPVWHGWGRKELTRADIEHSASSIRKAVEAILGTFPPK